jgi:hypothetical protein
MTRQQLIDKYGHRTFTGTIDDLIADKVIEVEPVEDVGLVWAQRTILDIEDFNRDVKIKRMAKNFTACHAEGVRDGLELAAKIADGWNDERWSTNQRDIAMNIAMEIRAVLAPIVIAMGGDISS